MLILFASAILSATDGLAQSIQLTPAQQQMLNSLPAAQRQQALSALRELQAKSPSPSVPSINEPRPPVESATDVEVLLAAFADAEPRAASRSRLVIDFSPSDSLLPADLRNLRGDPALDRLIGSHLFILDEAGILSLPGLETIPLLGLEAEDIQRRLEAENSLASARQTA